MSAVLDTIIARKRLEVKAAKAAVPMRELKKRIRELGRPRNFFGALVDRRNPPRTHVIAEVKRKSPSAGVIREDFDPVRIARQYAANGACAISCLTDEVDFGGRLEYIHQIRDAIKLPVLRKDFIIDRYQLWEARAAGADAVLLIAEALPERDIIDFQILATELGMTVLLEVHDVENLWVPARELLTSRYQQPRPSHDGNETRALPSTRGIDRRYKRIGERIWNSHRQRFTPIA